MRIGFLNTIENQKAKRGLEKTGRKVYQKGMHVKIENQKFGYHILRYPLDNAEVLGNQKSNCQCCVLH